MDRRRFLVAASVAAAGGAGFTLSSALSNRTTESVGTMHNDVVMRSAILDTDVLYSVYLPAQHSDSENLPVVYLLHGGTSDDNTTWTVEGGVKRTLDEMITDGRLPPLAVVTPDARRDIAVPADEQNSTYYMNDLDGGFRFEDMFLQELMPHVESEYGLGGSPAQRGISGYSMGGFGALMFATLYPGTFAGVAGLSTSHRTDEQIVEMSPEEYNDLFGSAWGFDLEGEERLNEHRQHYNLADIIRRTPHETLRLTDYYFTVGSEDEATLIGAAELHDAFASQHISYDFHMSPGGHDWHFWREAVGPGLEFLASRFSAPGDAADRVAPAESGF